MEPYQSYVKHSNQTSLIDAFDNLTAKTLNGCATNITSSNPLVDLFFTINTFRNKEKTEVLSAFYNAYTYSPVQALKILFWSRDIRGGQGERKTFRTCIKDLALKGKCKSVLPHIPYFGRWDDVLVFMDTPLENEALALIKSALDNDDALCAKWMPREKSSKSAHAVKIRNYLKLTPKQYRKMLSTLTKVVENQMCSNDWNSIEYGRVPSRATLIYRKAFERNSPVKWEEYVQAVQAGEEKVNAGALYPYDIVVKIWDDYIYSELNFHSASTELSILDEQWKALPNYLENSSERILPLVDTSGSMYSGSGSPLPIQVSVSLGLYIAERNEGPFKDHFLTFSQNPTMQKIEGDNIQKKLISLKNADWGYNTDLEAVFQTLLNAALASEVSATEMPTVILIFSDMEFDQATNSSLTAYETMQALYSSYGYQLPKIVFWNLDTKTSNFPVRFDQEGTAMVSGFSPSLMTQILAGGDITPESIMSKTIDSERYSCIG